MSRLLIFYLGSLTLRSFIVAALAGLATLRMRSVAGRHAAWTAILGFMLLMPLADALLPASLVPPRVPQIVLPVQTFIAVSPVAAIKPHVSAPAPAPVPERPSRDWWQVAVFVWIGVAAAFLLRLALASAAIVRMKRAGQSVSHELMASHALAFGTATIRESREVTIPLTLGLWRPVLMLPLGWRDWDDWKLRAVLAHELTHVRRRDWAIGVTASLVRSVFWFNALSWWLERNLSSLAEQASDEACVRVTGDAPRYAETLLQFASVAKRGRRWIGGVAMAQYKISSRIERVLGLQHAGSGVLSRAGWVAVCGLAIPVLYASAAAQSLTTTQMPPLSPAEILRVMRQPSPQPEQTAMMVQVPAAPQQPAPPAPATPPAPPAAPVPTAPPAAPVAPAQVNPDLLGEIRLILAPVDQQLPGAVPGQVQVQTSTGTNRFTGTAVWNVRNGALDPNSWSRNGNAFTFALTGAQGRTLSFETRQGGTFSYGCADCSFIASESGVGALSANAGTGIIFRLSPDGKSVIARCRAIECSAWSEVAWLGNSAPPTGVRNRILKDSESFEFPAPQQPSVDPNTPRLRCFSVFGNVKADGTPFTGADCPGGTAVTPSSVMFFSVTR